MDKHGNIIAIEGCDECVCGSKYWEKDRCVDCGAHIGQVINAHLDQFNRDKLGNFYALPDNYRWATVHEAKVAEGTGDFAQMIHVIEDNSLYLAVREGYRV